MSECNSTHPSKPTIVFVPGAYHSSAHFQPLSILLERASFPTLTISVPSIGDRAATASYRDDVRAIRATLDKLVEDAGKDVMLALHSLGGVSGCQTVTGLEKSKRLKEGKRGGIVHVLFITALVIGQGQKLRDCLEGGLPSWNSFDGEVLRPVNTSSVFYSQLSANDAEYWSSLLLPQSAVPSFADAGEVCYDLDVPITYLLCNGDVMVGMLERMVEKVKRDGWKIEKIDGDHCPFLSNKEGMVRVIEGCLSTQEA